ncbi:MAG: hypothetical protein ABFC42_12495 [Sulfuricella sp.]
MAVTINIGDAITSLQGAVEGAYKDGFSAGYKAAIDAVIAATRSLPNAPYVDLGDSDSVHQDVKPANVTAPRAPRGLAEELLDRILSERPGLTQQEVEDAVVAADSRISPKSVYNRLRDYERKGKKYRRKEGRWYKIADIPPDFPVMRNGALFVHNNGREVPM